MSARLRARPDAALLLAPPLAVLCGFLVAAGLWTYAFVALMVAAGVLVGLRDWRFSIYALLAFLPYSGLLIIAAYPDTGMAVLAKDFLFVIPAYIGFGGAYLLERKSVHVPGFPLAIAIALAIAALVQLLNPSLPNLVAGLIGLKVWVMYIAMALLGYHLVRRREDLERMLRVMALAAIAPCAIGIVEGVLVAAGHGDAVYSLYGEAAAVVTQGFANVGGETGDIRRVPSTFSFVAQYFLFTMAMLAVAFAYWRGFLSRGRGLRPLLGGALFLMVAFAGMLTGARGALFAVPVMTIVMVLLLGGHGLRRHWWIPFASLAVLVGVASVFGTTPRALVVEVAEHGVVEFTIGTIDGFSGAVDRTTFGLGTGVDTVAARYGLPDVDPYALIGGKVAESWWVKSFLELGILGLAITVALLLTVLARLVSVHRRLTDPSLRAVSAAFVGLTLFIVFYNFKASYLDLDPMNVLFWLFVGVTLRLPALEREEREAAREHAARGRAPAGTHVPAGAR